MDLPVKILTIWPWYSAEKLPLIRHFSTKSYIVMASRA
jgi:hypothetical protein